MISQLGAKFVLVISVQSCVIPGEFGGRPSTKPPANASVPASVTISSREIFSEVDSMNALEDTLSGEGHWRFSLLDCGYTQLSTAIEIEGDG
jgi:hypothetical protein